MWTGQEPDFDSPFNLGLALRQGRVGARARHGRQARQVPDEARRRQVEAHQLGPGDRRDRRQAAQDPRGVGSRLVLVRGSSKASNEGSYLQRKFAAFWGSNNCDHQARICHSTTVAGVANTWGYGAMTNSYNDMHNCKAMLFIGSNAAEAHPVAMQHVLRGKENGAKMIVVDPRFTRTAAHANQYIRIRSGTDVPFIWGLLWHIFENGWEDKEYIAPARLRHGRHPQGGRRSGTRRPSRTSPAFRRTRCTQCAKTMAENRPGTHRLVHGRHAAPHRQQQHPRRTACSSSRSGNIGVAGGGANIFRGHDNVQGATDVGPELPHAAGLLRAVGRRVAALGAGLGRRLRLAQGALRQLRASTRRRAARRRTR